MGVKTVFKVLFGTVIAICLITFLTEMYNASSHGNLLRQKIDSSAETALNYYTQESFRQEGDYATVNLPDFVSTLDPTLPYVSGHFYDYPDDPVRQVHSMFNWYKGTAAPTYGKLEIQNVATLKDGQTYDYTGKNGLGFKITVRRLPTAATGDIFSPYNRVMPAQQLYLHKGTGGELAFSKAEYLGVTNRYLEDVCELSQWNNVITYRRVTTGKTFSDYSSLVDELTDLQDNYASRNDLQQYYQMGGLDAIKQIVNAHETGYTPINVGFPLFTWELNQMFRWNLVSALSGAGIETLDGGVAVESSAIMPDDNGINCVRWNGFNVYVDQAKIDELFYYCYDLYNDTDLDDFCAKTGMNKSDVLALKTFAASGYEGKAYPNTVVGIGLADNGKPNGDTYPHCYVIVVDLHYNVPVGYQGLTAFRRVINWATNQNAGGYGEFLGGPSAASPGTSATYSTNNIGGSVDDDGFVVNSSLQYVMMP